MSRSERRALALLFFLALAGHLLRAAVAAPGTPPGEVTLLDPAGDGDPLAHRDSSRALAAPLAAGERIDVNAAPAEALGRLPGVGPALARRIVADRESHGAFGGSRDLDRVPGIGAGLLARLADHVSYGPVSAASRLGSAGPGAAPLASGPLDLNQASAEELDALPGIGPARASAIVAFRDSAGPFREIGDLALVPGVSERMVARLAGLLTVR